MVQWIRTYKSSDGISLTAGIDELVMFEMLAMWRGLNIPELEAYYHIRAAFEARWPRLCRRWQTKHPGGAVVFTSIDWGMTTGDNADMLVKGTGFVTLDVSEYFAQRGDALKKMSADIVAGRVKLIPPQKKDT